MSIGEEQSARRGAVEPDLPAETMGYGGSDAGAEIAGSSAPSAAPDVNPMTPLPQKLQSSPPAARRLGSRWWMLAAGSALLLTTLTIAAVFLVSRKPATVDQLIILTVPSGADVKIDAKSYGHTPVKLEQLTAGTYRLTIEKENYEPIDEQITVTADTPQLEYKLKVLPSPEAAGASPEEARRRFEEQANEAMSRGQYLIPYQGSAYYYVQQIQRDDESNAFAADMADRIRRTELQIAREASAGGDFAKARDIYTVLDAYFGENEEVRLAVARFENQVALHRGDVISLVKKASDALQAGNLIDPARASAYYFAKAALAIDRQNAQARSIYNQVKETLLARADDADKRGELDSAIKQLTQLANLYSEDRALHQKVRELESRRTSEATKADDLTVRRSRGLERFGKGEYAAAIPDLEAALSAGNASTEVIFALGRAYMMVDNPDKAAGYLRRVPPSGDDQYRSAIAALGDIARERGDYGGALDRYKQARALGGSTLYSVAKLDDRIEQIEKKERAKAAEPTPITVHVKHLHGGLIGGSCSGSLTISSIGVRYDGSEHTFSSNLLATGVRISKEEMVVKFQDKNEKFKIPRADAERFNETLSRFQQFYSPANK